LGVADHVADAGKLMAVTIEPTRRCTDLLKHFSKKRLKIAPGEHRPVGRAGLGAMPIKNPDTISKQYPYPPIF
jgi:hypothetical protein